MSEKSEAVVIPAQEPGELIEGTSLFEVFGIDPEAFVAGAKERSRQFKESQDRLRKIQPFIGPIAVY